MPLLGHASGLSLFEADSLFDLRSAQLDTVTLIADSAMVNMAMKAYSEILNDSGDSSEIEEAAWKTLRCVFFKGLFITHDTDYRKRIYRAGINVGEKYLVIFPDSAPLHSWLGVLWGYWGEVNGKMASAKKGVPGKVREHAEKTVELDSLYLDGAGYRMLGRANFKIPKIPLLLGWPSKEKAEIYLEKANAIGPDNLFNQLYLAEVLIERGKKERGLVMLRDILNVKETRHGLASDLLIKREAREWIKKTVD